jgi:hypothetical protein
MKIDWEEVLGGAIGVVLAAFFLLLCYAYTIK